jgi:hypothetical protein
MLTLFLCLCLQIALMFVDDLNAAGTDEHGTQVRQSGTKLALG